MRFTLLCATAKAMGMVREYATISVSAEKLII